MQANFSKVVFWSKYEQTWWWWDAIFIFLQLWVSCDGSGQRYCRGALPAVEQFLLLPAHLSKGIRLLVKLRSISRDLIKVHWPPCMLIWNHRWSRNYVNFMELCLTLTCNWKVNSSFSPTFINRHMYFGPLTTSFLFQTFYVNDFGFCHIGLILLKLLLCQQDVKTVWWTTCWRKGTWLTRSLLLLECGKLQFHSIEFAQLCIRTAYEALEFNHSAK